MIRGYFKLGFGWLRIAPALQCAALALAWLSSGCGSAPVEGDEPLGLESQAIEWGVVDGVRPAVGKLADSRGSCTATLLPHFTGGLVVNQGSDIVLSAAHCSDQLATQYFYVDDGSGSGLTRYRVDAMAMKPYRDLMIMHLSTKVPVLPNVPAVFPATTYAINTGDLPAIGSACTAVGYGRHDQDDGTSGARHSADVTVSKYSGTAAGADTRIYTRGVNGQTASGDSGGPLLCNGKIAGVLSSGPEWPFSGPSVQVSYTAVDVDWIQRYMDLAPPAVTYSLYMIEAGTLWRADPLLGNRERVTASGVLANPTGLAALAGQIYALLDGWLVQIDPTSGTQTTIGTQIWSGANQLVSLADSLYAIQNGALWRVTNLSTGARQRIGTFDWTGAVMTGIVRDDGLALLWMVKSNRVWWLDPATLASNHSTADWDGVTSIANVNGTPFLVHANGLWQVDSRFPVTLSLADDSRDWTDTMALASLDRHVYAIQHKWLTSYYLHTGEFQQFNHWGWSDSTLLTALP